MNRSIPARIRWLGIVGAWLAFGLAFSAQSYTYLRSAGSERTLREVLGSHLFFVALWIALTPFILWAARRFPLRRGLWARHGLVHLALGIAVALAQRATHDFVLLRFGPNRLDPFTWTVFAQSVLGFFDYGVLLYLIVLLVSQAFAYQKEVRDGEIRASRLAADLANARLQALQMQLQPHFLFNTLNAITVLVRSDPGAAEVMLRRLSDLLRATLENGGATEVPLQRELEFLDRYLHIAEVRFGPRLTIEREVDPAALKARVPFLILQPLAENALRHGIGSVPGPGVVAIRAARAGDHLLLEVRDTGPGLSTAETADSRRGVGLENTRARLAELYGEDHSLSLSGPGEPGFRVQVTLPFRPLEAT